MIHYETIREGVSRCLVKAGTTFRADQIEAYKSAIEKETNRNARWVLERLVENAEIAEKNGFPLCDDTGIPHLYVEIGNDLKLPEGWLSAIHEGVAQGLRTMPGRPMAVKGDDIERVEQSQGLSDDPADVLPVPVITKPVAGNRLGVTVLLLGGGPEIRAKTYRVFHKRSIKVGNHDRSHVLFFVPLQLALFRPDETIKVPGQLLVRALLVDHLREGEKRPRPGRHLHGRQRKDLEFYIRSPGLHIRNTPRFPGHHGRQFLGEGIFGISHPGM